MRKRGPRTKPWETVQSRNRKERVVRASERKGKWRSSSKTRREECQHAQIGMFLRKL